MTKQTTIIAETTAHNNVKHYLDLWTDENHGLTNEQLSLLQNDLIHVIKDVTLHLKMRHEEAIAAKDLELIACRQGI